MVINGKNIVLFWTCLFCIVAGRPISASVLDWLWTSDNDVTHNRELSTPMISIPYESKTEDEKFLEEALKFTDVMKSSTLDICQHKTVLKIKTSCSSMTEEELSKMSVNLLNCQSAVDGRKTFPCTEEMTLKECTVDMDANMWNAYHMMNNRARAVCYASRRAQFQALTEMTVNKLLESSQDQINRIASLQRGQEELETLTLETMGTVREGNIQVMLQQTQIQDAQKSIQNFVAFNLKELTREKALIAAGHKELAEMTQKVKDKLDEANKELLLQTLEMSGNHEHLINDIEVLRMQAEAIFKRIDESTTKLLAQHELASMQYKETIHNLQKINATVGYLSKLFSMTHSELEKRIDWIKSFLGDSSAELQRISQAVLHIAYLLMGMLLASFLQLPMASRASLIILVPLNLLLVYDNKSELALDFAQMTILLIFTIIVNIIINIIIGFVSPSKPQQYLTYTAQVNGNPPQPVKPSLYQRLKSYFAYIFQFMCRLVASGSSSNVDEVDGGVTLLNDSFVTSSRREPDEVRVTSSPLNTQFNLHNRKENPHNLVTQWLDRARFTERAGTPASSSVRSGSSRNACVAICRNGRRCKNPTQLGLEVCRRHEIAT